MKVRVFRKEEPDNSEYLGTDFDFEVMPSKDTFLRFSDDRTQDYTVGKIGFIQDESEFIAAVWLVENWPGIGSILGHALTGKHRKSSD